MIPAPISTSLLDVNVDNSSDGMIEISWDFGTVTNPAGNNNSLVLLQYTGVILDIDLFNVQLEFSGFSILSGFVVDSVAVNATVVKPILEIEVMVMVSDELL